MVSEKIASIGIKREPNYIYFVKSDEKTGLLSVYKAKMERGRKKIVEKKEPSAEKKKGILSKILNK